LEPAVAAAIAARLEQLNATVGYAAAACGADILFHEAMLARGGVIHVILPFAPEAFVDASVLPTGGEPWRQRFYRLLEQAADITIAKWQPVDPNGGQDYEDGNRLMTHRAQQDLQTVDGTLSCLAVWDQKPGDGPGGTASMVSYWHSLGLSVDSIAPLELGRSG
jgi:hypothetical protein